MAVLTGQGLLFAAGYDVSGDIAALSRAGGGPNLIDTSPLSLAGTRRLAGRFDGEIAASVLFNPTGAHVPFAALPTTAVPLMFALPGTAAGDFVTMLVAKQADYSANDGNDLATLFSLSAMASEGYPLEWGKMITAGKRTDTSATASGTGIDLGVPPGVAAVTLTSSTAASPTEVTAAAVHGLQTGDSVIIAGTDQATLNDEWTVTVTSTTKFTVPCDLSGAGASSGGTVQRTSRRGWSAQNQVFSIAGTSVTVTVQDSHEAVSGSFANVTGGAFTAVSAGSVGGQRLGSATGILKQYVRVKTTGTFSSAVFATGIYGAPG